MNSDDSEVWLRLQTVGKHGVGRPRKGSARVTYRELGFSKRDAHRMRVLSRLSPDDLEAVATRKITLREATERVYGTRLAPNPLFAAWRKASRGQRNTFVHALMKTLEDEQFFAERKHDLEAEP